MSTQRRGPRPAHERLRRLLVMLPWLMERGEVPVDEMADHFEVSATELVHDLELASMCGLPPYIDEMIDVWIDEGVVHAGVPRLFTRPLRLTAPEGFALLVAGRAAMQLPGAEAGGALDRALVKLAAALGGGSSPGAEVVVDAPRPPATDDVAVAAAEGARLRITYWSAWRDERTTRVVTPRAVFLDRGNWYVVADDQASGEERRFRIDRIETWERTGEVDPLRGVQVPSGDDWFAGDRMPTVTLVLGERARWAAERYPLVSRRETDAGLEVVLTVASERWLGELLLRLGPDATVVEPATWSDLGPRTAASLLARYEASGS